MNEIELKMMQGMVSILNHKESLTEEQYESRLEDLRQFEQETNFVLLNSPTQNVESESIVKKNDKIYDSEFSELNSVEDIVKNFDQKEMIAYANLNGTNVYIKYADGVIKRIITDNIDGLKQCTNIPYKINKTGHYRIYGKLTLVDDNLKFFVDETIDYVDSSVKNGFEKAKELGFDIVPYWYATSLNPKTLQNTIDYIFDYVAEEGLSCDGIMFRIDDVKNQEIFKLKKEGDNNHG